MKFQLGTIRLINKEPEITLLISTNLYTLHSLLNHKLINSKGISKQLHYNSFMELIQEWDKVEPLLENLVEIVDLNEEEFINARLGSKEYEWMPPLIYPKKLICVGANYKDHLLEMGVEVFPTYPISFIKPSTTSVVGSEQTVKIPIQTKKVDWEAELAIVIGKSSKNLASSSNIMEIVAGYTITNDISARDWLEEINPFGLDLLKMKGYDGFSPLGPLVTPAQFIEDPHNLDIRTFVNGVLKQNSNTENMVFNVTEILKYLVSIMTLEPGDVICTGTPAGVGSGLTPPEYLKAKDTVTVEIEDIGELKTEFI